MRQVAILVGVLLLAACGGSETLPEEPAAPEVHASPAVTLYAIDCGRIDILDAGLFADDGSHDGQSAEAANPCYLIRHPAGDLIWDTGVPEAIASMPDGLNPPGFPVHVTMAKTLTDQLGELGLAPADIEFLSFSHLHFDHTGNGNLFAGATWIVDKDERDAMFSGDARKTDDFQSYKELENAKTVLVEGDATHDVFGDGSVVIHQAPGHTPGHAVLMVKFARAGPVLLSGDMWHLPDSRERRLVPRFNVDREATVASMDKVEALARSSGARLIRQHVPEDFATLPKFPAALE